MRLVAPVLTTTPNAGWKLILLVTDCTDRCCRQRAETKGRLEAFVSCIYLGWLPAKGVQESEAKIASATFPSHNTDWKELSIIQKSIQVLQVSFLCQNTTYSLKGLSVHSPGQRPEAKRRFIPMGTKDTRINTWFIANFCPFGALDQFPVLLRALP